MNTATQIAAMLWEYCRESELLRQALLAERKLADGMALTRKEWAKPSPRRFKLCGRFAFHLHMLAGCCPSWPDKPAQDCPEEVAKLARGFFPVCARIKPTVKMDGKTPSGQELVRKDWHYAERLPSDQADFLPIDVIKVDWRMSDTEIENQIGKLRPARFKDFAAPKGRPSKPAIFGERLPATPEAALKALQVLRDFEAAGGWIEYFRRHDPKALARRFKSECSSRNAKPGWMKKPWLCMCFAGLKRSRCLSENK